MHQTPKSTQRARLTEAMSQLAVQEGYLDVSIAEVIAEAGVSRPTFYEYFAHKEDCLLAAVAEVQGPLLAELRGTLAAAQPQDALGAVIDTLIALASATDGRARLLLVEAMAAGALVLDARDEGVAEIGQMLQARYALAARDTPLPDVSPRMLVGGVCRLLGLKLEGEQANLAGMCEELLAWTRGYERPAGEHRWRSLEHARLLGAPSVSAPLRAPIALPREGSRASRAERQANQRQRILFAAAQLAERAGYASTTIAQITARAGVDIRAFRRQFASKQDVFEAVHQLYFQHILAVSAQAFALSESWPEQVWHAGRAFTQLVEENPAFAHIAFVESHAAGRVAMKRAQEHVVAFAVFLQAGFRELAARQVAPSDLALEAIALTNFEIAYRQCRGGEAAKLSALLPHVTYLSLAPFLGAVEANEFIEGKLGGSDST